MAEERSFPSSKETQRKRPWALIFSGFKVALDIRKLLLAAAGILLTAFGWWLLAVIFFSARAKPEWKAYEKEYGTPQEAWLRFKEDRRKYNLLHEMAGDPDNPERVDAADVSQTLKQYEDNEKLTSKWESSPYKVAGRLRTWPWFEYRGPNPYLLVSSYFGAGQSRSPSGAVAVPASVRPSGVGEGFFNWLIYDQAPVLAEPLRKFLAPVFYSLDPAATGFNRIYLILVLLWTLTVWGLIGGAITRLAAVQIARNERISMRSALLFTRKRALSFVLAPIFPLAILTFIAIGLTVFGLIVGFTYVVGDILAGLLWPLVLIAGLIMAVVLIGLAGWPLMNATISTEGSDSLDAFSRSYSYVYQAPWHFLWYAFLALVYGAALVFFVGLMGSLLVYMGKWGVSQAPWLSSTDPARDREPTYLFIYAPTSLQWRDLLLDGSPYAETKLVPSAGGVLTPAVTLKEEYVRNISGFNQAGAILTSIWLYLVFLLMIGFSYSYFWTASTIIYMLLRRHVEDTELDEIHMEEEAEEPLPPLPTEPMAATTAPSSTAGVTMVPSPTLRAPTTTTSASSAPPVSGPPLSESKPPEAPVPPVS